MTHPDIERMERTGLKPWEKDWYSPEEYDPWLVDREDEDE